MIIDSIDTRLRVAENKSI
jgi:hypothetical protein